MGNGDGIATTTDPSTKILLAIEGIRLGQNHIAATVDEVKSEQAGFQTALGDIRQEVTRGFGLADKETALLRQSQKLHERATGEKFGEIDESITQLHGRISSRAKPGKANGAAVYSQLFAAGPDGFPLWIKLLIVALLAATGGGTVLANMLGGGPTP